MREFAQYALLGLGAGALYVVLAQGIVLIFRGSGVLNLAHGAFAMLAAYSYNELHANSQWPLWRAMLVVVAGTAVLGLLTDVLLMRRLRRASPLARLIATLGVLLVISSVATLKWGASPTLVLPIITPHEVTVLGVSVTSDRLWLLAIAGVITLVLAAGWRFTRVGWIAEAVAESESGAAALGWSPRVVSGATWTVGAGLAGLAGILISPITQLNVAALTFLVIPTLAATLVGGFRSFGLTFAGGIAIGVAQSLAGQYIHVFGIADALPFLIIVGVLIAAGSSLPLRGYVLDRMPLVGLGRVDVRFAGPAAAALAAITLLVTATDWQAMFATTLAIAIILLSLVVLTGYAGQLSLAQYALAGLGALIAARLVAAQGWPFELALCAGVLGSTLIGLLVALPALRTRGVNLAVVTLGLGLAAQSTVFNNPSYTGGISGTNVGSQRLFGISIDPIAYPVRYTFLVLVCFLGVCILVANVRRSRSGRRFLAVRANERSAASCGINVFAAKLHAFALSGALAGLGGVLLAFQSTAVSFTSFDPLSSITAVAQTVIGAVGFVLGPLLGAVLSPQSLASLIQNESIQHYLPLIGGVGVLITLIQNPDGVVATVTEPLRRFACRRLSLRPRVATIEMAGGAPPQVPPRTLTVRGLTVRYGGVLAVSDISFTLSAGEILALIGPNGAGKTSLMDALTGFAPYSGSVELDDIDLRRLPAHRRAAQGIARSWQGLELFDDLTVVENLLAASDEPRRLGAIRDAVRPGRPKLTPTGAAVVREFELSDCLERYPDELSYGRRRLIAIARTVAMQPSVILLDEPVAGLDDHESAEFAQLVRRLADVWGMAVLVIEHDMDFVMELADRVVVMDFGREVAAGSPTEIQRDPAAIAAYLGQDPSEAQETAVP